MSHLVIRLSCSADLEGPLAALRNRHQRNRNQDRELQLKSRRQPKSILKDGCTAGPTRTQGSPSLFTWAHFSKPRRRSGISQAYLCVGACRVCRPDQAYVPAGGQLILCVARRCLAASRVDRPAMASAAAGRQQAACFKCGQTGHWGNACTVPREQWISQPRPAADAECYKCGRKGHYSRDCTAPRDQWVPQRQPGSAPPPGTTPGAAGGPAGVGSGDENNEPLDAGCYFCSQTVLLQKLAGWPSVCL